MCSGQAEASRPVYSNKYNLSWRPTAGCAGRIRRGMAKTVPETPLVKASNLAKVASRQEVENMRHSHLGHQQHLEGFMIQ